MSDNLLSVEDMSEIPTTHTPSSVPSGGGGSKGANLFLARQKLIADMMEQEEAEREAEERHREAVGGEERGVTTKVHKPVAFTASSVHNSGPSNKDSHKISSEIQHSVSMSATEGVKASEIPATSQNSGGGGRSKGVNLFLARQKQIADMMEQEEEEARAAEEAKVHEEEARKRREELERQRETERLKQEEEMRIQQEKLLESERKKAARAAKFKSSKVAAPEPEPDLPWVKKDNKAKKSGNDDQRKTLYQLLSADKK